MSFDSLEYLLFLALVLALVALRLPRAWVVLAASVAFYLVAGWLDVGLIAATILVNYAMSFLVVRDRRWLFPTLGLTLLNLAAFKYADFLLGRTAEDIWLSGIVIPLGISFYTFQILSYQIDLARGTTAQVRSLPRFALYVGFFPQLIAGPIVRANQLVPQLARWWEGRRPRRVLIDYGLALILLGLFKKIVLADSLAPHVDAVFTQGPANAATAWLGAYLFGFQLYFDFSAYSEIALGSAYLLGIRLPVNFRQPFLAADPQAFWRRWHITLSNWIRDYLFFPLMHHQRVGHLRQIAVFVGVMGLAGLWHGAGWPFIIWGAAWGAYMALWRWLGPLVAARRRLVWLGHLAVVTALWVLFRVSELDQALSYYATMLGLGPAGGADLVGDPLGTLWVVLGAGALMGSQLVERRLAGRATLAWLRRHRGPLLSGLLVGLCLWLVLLPEHGHNPFIYFRF